MKENNKKALIVAYYLSRFDKTALNNLGYKTDKEAFLDIGKIFEVNHNSVKNMRDEFDPIHENRRAGWHQRSLRPSRECVVRMFQERNEEDVREFVLGLINNDVEDKILKMITESDKKNNNDKNKFILRGPTGRHAEEIFYDAYVNKLDVFNKELPYGVLRDTRDFGCGYDYEIGADSGNCFVEIKGMAEDSGGILFTNKEWDVARTNGNRYYLVIVKNVISEPSFTVIQNPYSVLSPKKNVTTTIQVSWSVPAGQI